MIQVEEGLVAIEQAGREAAQRQEQAVLDIIRGVPLADAQTPFPRSVVRQTDGAGRLIRRGWVYGTGG